MTEKTPAERAVAEAMRAWKADIIDPPTDAARYEKSRRWIREFITDGLLWPQDGLRYDHDGQFAWCGAFVAWCYRETLRADIRKSYLASTYRLSQFGTRTSIDLVRPGDVLIVGDVKPYGDHIALVERVNRRVDGTVCTTIEGNAHGDGPYGHRQEGVVRCKRALKVSSIVYRFVPEDFEATK